MIEERLLKEELNGPLPDLGKALARIGVTEPIEAIDLATLDMLTKEFISHVPYENLTVSIQKKAVSLQVLDLYEKIVTYRRGGYCFEMNGLYYLMLRDLGYKVYSVCCFVLTNKRKVETMSHRASVVEIEGKKYLCDVGFGGKYVAKFAVPLDGTEKNGFFISDIGDNEYILNVYIDDEKEESDNCGERIDENGKKRKYLKVIMFRDQIAYPEDFVLPNLAVQHIPNHPMLANIIVNLRNANGDIYTMYNDEFKMKTADGNFSQIIEDEEERMDILREFYGMDTSCFE